MPRRMKAAATHVDTSMHLSRSVLGTGMLLAALLSVVAQAQTSRTIAVTGTLTDAGVQCQAVQGDDGVLYTIRRTPAVRQLQAGDRIKVTGPVAELSICQQGVTIDVATIERAE